VIRCHGGVVVVLLVLLLAVGCGKDSTLTPRPPLDEVHQETVDHSNALALESYAALRDKPGNVVLSPYGVSLTLSMLLSGADGQTRDELLTVLGATAKQEPQLHNSQGELRRWLTGESAGGEQLEIAAGIFIQRDTDVLKNFLTSLETHYDSQANVVDFANQPATARKVINDWAAEKTHGMIDTVISPADVSPQTSLVMASAVYFKGAWEHAFERSRTERQPFFVTADKTIECDLMQQSEGFGYAHLDGIRVLVMPYRGYELSMAVILPDDMAGLSAVEERLEAETLTSWVAAAEKNVVDVPVWIPRFKVENGLDLEPALQQLGVKTAFDPAAADLSRIDGLRSTSAVAGRLFVDRIWQQSLIEVNEEGTEAAAVTGFDAAAGDKAPRDPPSFRADHPFLFLIRENQTGLILFMGRVVDPTK
jgi:serpin B